MILRKQYNYLERMASGSAILILFFLAHTILLLMMLFTFPRINAVMGTNAFDLKTFGYSYEEAIAMLENLDASTAQFYIFPQLFLLDFLYPALLALFLSTLIIRLSVLTGIKQDHLYSNLFLLPFPAMLCDYLENLMILVMIKNYSVLTSDFIYTASFFTQMKGVFTTLSWVVILVLAVIWLIQKIKSKAQVQPKPGVR